MRNLVCIVLLLCSTVLACNREDPFGPELGDRRIVAARLSNAEWQPCCRKPDTIRTNCRETIWSREEALELIVEAGGDCLDDAVKAVARYAPDDLAAAYLIRGERNHDPVDYLRSLETATGFNRALAQERLWLVKEAEASWDTVIREGSDWAGEARVRKNALSKLPDPTLQWSPDHLDQALRRGDRATVRKLVRAFPTAAFRHFEQSDLSNIGRTQMLAEAFAENGELYPLAVAQAMAGPKDPKALEEGLRAFKLASEQHQKRGNPLPAYERAVRLFERAENPLHLTARYRIAAHQFATDQDALKLLDAVIPTLKPGYRELSFRMHTLRAVALEYADGYLAAYEEYEKAFGFVQHDPTALVAMLTRRSPNYATVGRADDAFRDSVFALSRLSTVPDLNPRHQAYGSAAKAARQLGYPSIALQYQNAAVELIERTIPNAPEDHLPGAKQHLAIALRERADIHIELGRDVDAEADLQQAIELAESAEFSEDFRRPLRMRAHEVAGQSLLKKNPADAKKHFDIAIGLAEKQNSTYRAVLYYKRAAARRRTGDPNADQDIVTALNLLRNEATTLLDKSKRGDFERLWSPYFARFQKMHHDMIESRIAAGDVEGAFVDAEQARAFEPMYLLLESRDVPRGFRKIDSKAALQQHLDNIPEDTVILQYLVLPGRTYTWVLTRGRIELVRQRATRSDIEGWVNAVVEAVRDKVTPPFNAAMGAAYGQLFHGPLSTAEAATKDRIVIIADGPMHGLPFAALHDGGTYLIERGSIATAGSTSLYLYALARDRELAQKRPLSVFLVGDPRSRLDPLPGAATEVTDLARDYYTGAEVLTGAEATIDRFLRGARNATILHFAGHGIPNPQSPWMSRLLLTPSGHDSGELTAERLMKELTELEQTRLVVLGACSTAGGAPLGPEGLAPLVRPLIAANVPAVVGTLWEVNDATAKELLVSLHCHYRNGDDVAVALRNAQLSMLRRNRPAMSWAPYQVVGHADSPYEPRLRTMEENRSDDVCSQNSLHRPDGLRSQ